MRSTSSAICSISLGMMLSILFVSTTMTKSFHVAILPPSSHRLATFAAPSSKGRSSCTTFLLATKKKNTKKSSTSPGGKVGGGFGGAAMEPCPCGSSETYSRCCGRLHKDVNAFKSATASQVVRARYSAYAKKQAEFLMASTHPLHKDFDTDLKRWKDQIKLNMYDNFDLAKCHIVEESYEDEDDNNDDDDNNEEEITKSNKASVKFVAEMTLRESGETTGFMETSQFERAKTHGGWLYLSGTMEAAPDDLLVKNLDTTASTASSSNGRRGEAGDRKKVSSSKQD